MTPLDTSAAAAPLTLTHNQAAVFNSPARFRVLVAGRRFGKTHLALAEILRVIAEPGRLAWYVGPNDHQSKRIVWDRLKKFSRPYWAKRPNETELRIDCHSGSTVIVNGAFNPESLRGDGLDLIVLDEYASFKPEAWAEVFRPALADRRGRALFIGTPQGRNHFYDRFEYAHNDPNWQAFQFTTAQGGLVDADELLQAARELDPDSYRQEFGGEFVNAGRHRVYYTFNPALHLKSLCFEPGEPLVWSLDFNIDPMGMLLMQRIGDSVHVFDEIVLPNANTDAACQAFLDRIEPIYRTVPMRFRPLKIEIYGDSSGHQRRTSGADTDWQIIRRRLDIWKGDYQPVFHAGRSNPPVRDRINCVNSRLLNHRDEVRLFIDPRCRELIKDLEQVSWALDATGAPTSELDKSDRARTHLSDALGYYIAQLFPMKPPIGERPVPLF